MNYRKLSIYQRSLSFSINIIIFQKTLPKDQTYKIISSQLIRSSTSIAANIAEGSQACSRREFINFIQISLKSAVESDHWLSLINRLGHPTNLQDECQEIISILVTIIKRSKQSNNS